MCLTVSGTKLMYISSCVCTLCVFCKQADKLALKSICNYSDCTTCNGNVKRAQAARFLLCPFIPKHPKVKFKIICYPVTVKFLRYQKHGTDLCRI